MNIGELLSDSNFDNKGVLKKLICYFEGYGKEDVRLNIDKPLLNKDKIIDSYRKYKEEKMPLEYILGKVSFLGYDFVVNKNTLIPRPETEYMIEAINDETAKLQNSKAKNVLWDVGTGCGVLGLSALLHNHGFFHEAILCDYSQEALEIAKNNYNILVESGNLKVVSEHDILFMKSDLLEGVLAYCIDGLKILSDINVNVILVANLPYIPDKTFDNEVEENVKNWEPRMAFVGGNDGLDLYRRMFEQIMVSSKWQMVNNNGFVMFLEMMTWQVDILREEYKDKFVFEEIKTFHFNIRIVRVTNKGNE